MAIELETVNETSDNPYRVIRYGDDRLDYLMVATLDNLSEYEFRVAVFDILWQLAGGVYD